MIPLGAVAQDTITGFEGVVVCRSEWLYGCVRLMLQPQEMHEGQPLEAQTFDEPQLFMCTTPVEDEEAEPEAAEEAEPTEEEQAATAAESLPRAGPRPDPVRHPDLHRR